MKSKIRRLIIHIIYFFPLQLLFNNFKKNQILLLFWLILFGAVSNGFAESYGVPYLFLDPEYLGAVNFQGMFIVGLCLGIYTVSFHLTSYILDSNQFPFLGTVKYPFSHFCLNNSIIPILFLIVYSKNFVSFQLIFGNENYSNVFIQLAGMYSGFVLMIVLFFFYFNKTNKSSYINIAENVNNTLKKRRINTVRILKDLKKAEERKYLIVSYLTYKFKVKPVDQNIEYNKKELLKIFDQHHLNASVVEILVFIFIIILGFFKELRFFQIPAAASGLLLLSFFIMFTGAFSYWLRGWAITGIIALFFILNLFFTNGIIESHNEAFGLNYKHKKAMYSNTVIDSLSNATLYTKDSLHTIEILNNWRKKFPENESPKMIFLALSGGGQRSAVWSTNTIQYIDSTLGGDFFKHTMLMTGASGGMIGASYCREIYRRQIENSDYSLQNKAFGNNISKDILNPMVFSMVVSDLFFPYQSFNMSGHRYYQGRGFAFERQLNENTDGVMSKKVMDYYEDEYNGKIPIMILSPTIINDGRKLYISSQPVSYLNKGIESKQAHITPKTRGVEFMRLFKNQDAENLGFLSALRMNATFPYITPNITLPSTPMMEIMDAGISDNFGITDATRFLFTFRDWIEKNTDGVIFVSIRDSKKNEKISINETRSIFQNIFNPVGSLFSNWNNLQDFTNDENIIHSTHWFQNNVNLINFEYRSHDKENELERASLSWHLTTREKQNINQALYHTNITESANTLKNLLKK